MKLARRKMLAGFSYVSVVSARGLAPPSPARARRLYFPGCAAAAAAARLHGAEGYNSDGVNCKLDTKMSPDTLFLMNTF